MRALTARLVFVALSLLCLAQPAFAVCGDNNVEIGESCDDGNLTAGDCCSPTCQFEAFGSVCRGPAGVCDVAESCTGTSGSCPANSLAGSTSLCRAAAGPCDVSELCTGSSASCPSNSFLTSFTTCRAQAGICDVVESCTGSSASCPADSMAPSTTTCRAQAGICDVAELCSGTGVTCGANDFQPSTIVCRVGSGVCDPGESCTGSSATCPGNTLAGTSSVCRAAAGACDVAEACTGTSATCPGNSLASSAAICRGAAGPCDVAESCTGSSASCPANSFFTSFTTCRAQAGICDAAESCTGSNAVCPADDFVPSTVVCRAASGVCDPGEFCTGSTATCPVNSLSGTSTVCRAAAGACDVAESCTGTSSTCPGNLLASSSVVCRAAAGPCDAAEACSGTSAFCPGNSFLASFATCRAQAGVCDVAEGCTGSGASCPVDSFVPSTAVCRSATGICDPFEACTGSSATCPSDSFSDPATVCRAATGVCDVAETCAGTSVSCPINVLASTSTVCRAATGTCDVTESCTGTSTSCPANVFAAASTLCQGPGGTCDAGQCSGTGICVSADAETDGTADACDNCPSDFNPDQVNSDCPVPSFSQSDCPALLPADAGCCDGGDICDLCPAQPDNGNCDGSGSGAATIGSGGGSLSTEDGSVTVDVPAGALPSDTSISVTENGPVSDFTLYSGAVLSVSARPEDQEFDEPVTITMRWNDRDGDNLVDLGACVGGLDDGLSCDSNSDCVSAECTASSSVAEQDLVLKRNAVPFSSGGFGAAPFDCDAHLSGACSTADANCNDAAGTGLASVAGCCNKAANEWAFKTCNFSEYVVGDAVAGLIPGGGSASTDCATEWMVDNPLNSPAADKRGFPNSAQSCTDGDLTCDADGTANGSCSFEVAVCLNVNDPRLIDKPSGAVACTPSTIAIWSVPKPHPDSKPPGNTNGTALRDAVSSLGTAGLTGKHNETLVFTPPVAAAQTCTSFVPIVVPLKNGVSAGKAIVKTRATVAAGDLDKDKLKLTCLPPP